jgi:antibiotic biosynthesis monooxygenase (ABM) superfamily enzyme
MIARIWHGYTTLANAASYESLLKREVFIAIERKNVPGYLGIQLLKRQAGAEMEFTTIMTFTDLDAVKQFAGDDFERAYVPDEAKKLLLRFDQTSIHCEVVHELYYDL